MTGSLSGRCRPVQRSVLVRPQDLGPYDRFVQVELAVELLHVIGLGRELDNGVDAFGLVVDLVGQPTPTPDVDLVDGSAGRGDDLEELVEGWLYGALF